MAQKSIEIKVSIPKSDLSSLVSVSGSTTSRNDFKVEMIDESNTIKSTLENIKKANSKPDLLRGELTQFVCPFLPEKKGPTEYTVRITATTTNLEDAKLLALNSIVTDNRVLRSDGTPFGGTVSIYVEDQYDRGDIPEQPQEYNDAVVIISWVKLIEREGL